MMKLSFIRITAKIGYSYGLCRTWRVVERKGPSNAEWKAVSRCLLIWNTLIRVGEPDDGDGRSIWIKSNLNKFQVFYHQTTLILLNDHFLFFI